MEPPRLAGRVDAAWGRTVPVGAGLAALAVSQPLLDLFGRNPTFFVARGATDGEILAFGCLVALVPALVAIALVAAAAAVGERAGAAAHHLVVVVLGALLTAGMLHPHADGGWLFVVGSVAAGTLLALAEAHLDGVRSGFECLTPLPVVVLALFAFASPTARLVWQPAAAAAPPAHVERPADVALLVLDELPLASLLRADGTIDAGRFPNFARLAASGTWYRNASSSYARTELAVPSLLSGRRPPPGAIPSTVDHPRNLFTLLAGTYRMNVVEEVTDLCPDNVCGPDGSMPRPGGGPLGALDDAGIVYAHQVVPAPWSDRLPVIGRSWGDFGGATEADDPFARRRDDAPGTRTATGRVAFADRMIRGVRAGDAPSLDVAHLVFPHAPWTLTPDGQEYGATLEGLTFEPKEQWADDEVLVRRGQAHHLLQVGYADAVLGRLLDRLEAQGRFDDALVAVVADHGAAFVPGAPMREPSGTNDDEVFRVPLFVKAPGQATGVVDDRPAQTVDLLPTIVDLLGVETSWAFDGVPLRPDGRRPDPVVVVPTSPSPQPFPREVEPLLALARRNARRFPDTGDWRGVFAVGPHGDLVGRPASALSLGTERARWTWSSPDLAALADVDRDGPFLPLQLGGTVAGGHGTPPPAEVLLAVDGTIAGVGDVRADGTGGWAFVALVDPAVLRDGANALDLYVPDAGGERFSRARPAHAGRPELGRESVVLDGRERPLTPPDDAESLEVARAFTDGRSVTVEGLAVSAGTTRPEDVVLFVHGRPVSSGADPYPTLDEGGAELERWGFVLQVPSDEVGRARHGTLVAIYDDHAAAIAVAWR
ncbi:MAG: sulfatase-like hydrolase/transferase [Acidimicrobiales bacterium]|nr:sulfatase-like hydrolase/transferase [Acidimicrobiales bacterium]